MSIWRRARDASACLVVGHRGGRGEGWPPENSLAAFEQAQREGARAIETDARLASTGEVVLCHDPDLVHASAGSDRRKVAQVDATSLAALGLARLDDALAWAHTHGVAVNVEIKRDVPRPLALCRAVARVIGRTKADVLVSSFDPAVVGAMAALAPRTPRAWLLHPQHGRASLMATRALSSHLLCALHPERTMITPALVARWKRRGLAIGTYTVNDREEGVRLALLGVDWIVSDTPGAMIAAINGPATDRARS